MSGAVQVIPLTGMGEIRSGDDLGQAIRDVLEGRDPTNLDGASRGRLEGGDVLVVSSKIIAKAEGMTVTPRPGESVEQARQRLTLEHEVLVQTPFVTVVRTPDGLVCANAGIDASNVADGELLLLPADPDASAARIRTALADLADVGVVVSDTFGRAWREGQTDVAIGVAGLAPLRDERGTVDRGGRVLDVTLIALADQVAGAADLVRDKAAGVPVVLVRGLSHDRSPGSAHELVRDPAQDLFPHGRGWLARHFATGEGATTRPGPPTAWEWELIQRAVPEGSVDQATFTTSDAFSAGRAEACLLDLGYGVARERSGTSYRLVVQSTAGHDGGRAVGPTGAAGPSETQE